jgi:hypothetical protein
VTRLILLIILGFAASYYFPDSRRMLVDKTKALWVPVVEWNTKQKMRQVARDVADEERETGQVPDRRDWKQWLDYRYTMESSKTDAWGSVFGLRVLADSIEIISYGPDRKPGTDDDFTVAVPRDRVGRR